MSDSPGLCPRFHAAIELIGKRWTGAVVQLLLTRPMRFNELLGSVPGISDRLLSERLRELELHGVVNREMLRPTAVQYAVTDAGRALAPALELIGEWGEQYLRKPTGPE